jgi:hypothetical protein
MHTTISPLDEGYDFFITDIRNNEYHFKILTFEVPSGMLSVAVEVAEETDIYCPRKIEILSDYNVDVESAELQLKAKIKREINFQSLFVSENDDFEIIDNILIGNIIAETKEAASFKIPLFAIDGKKISIEQFLRMLAPYDSFKFKLEIFDPSDEIS